MLPEMIEGAVNAIVARLQEQFNHNLELVRESWLPDRAQLNLTPVAPSEVYISEGAETFQPPAIFVVPDDSPHDLRAQNWLKQDHVIWLGIVVEDRESQRLQRLVWRYAQAAWLTLHDQHLGATQVLVARITYGPTALTPAVAAGLRSFRKDVTIRLSATQREAFP